LRSFARTMTLQYIPMLPLLFSGVSVSSGVLGFFDSGQILGMYVVLLHFSIQEYSSFTGVMCRVNGQYR